MIVYLIRHGKTTANEKKLYCGQTDALLSESGKKELEEKKTAISYPDASKFKVYTSGLTRTEETLKILFGNVPFEVNTGFMEINFGDFENRSYEMMKDDPDFIKWCEGDNNINIPPGEGAESRVMLNERVVKAFKELVSKNEDCIIVTHAGPIAGIFEYYNPDSGLNYYQISPKNGEGYVLRFENGEFNSITKFPE